MGRSSSTVSATYGGTSSMTEAYRRMSVQEQQHQGTTINPWSFKLQESELWTFKVSHHTVLGTYEEAAAHERRMSGRSYGSVDYQFGGDLKRTTLSSFLRSHPVRSQYHSYKIYRLYVRHCGLMKPFVLDQFDAPELDSDTESQLNQSTKELGIHPIIGLESMEIISFIGEMLGI